MHILVIEDDAATADYLRKGLRESGHVVDHAATGKDGLFMAMEGDYDTLIVDRMLPELDGLTVIQTLRSSKDQTPVLILSALGEVDDRVKGLHAGGDDYLVKPFELLEVYARVQALWRRTKLGGRSRLSVADLTLDPETREVKRGEVPLQLNPVPFRILQLLMENSHRVVSRREIEAHVWGDDTTDSDALRTHISALRNAIDKPFAEKLLHTVHGIGYRLYAKDAGAP